MQFHNGTFAALALLLASLGWAPAADASHLKQITLSGTFNDSLAGTDLDAGDPYVFTGIVDTSVPDIVAGNTQIGIYPEAIASGDFTIDGGALTVSLSQDQSQVDVWDNLGQDRLLISDFSVTSSGFDTNVVGNISITFNDPISASLSGDELASAVAAAPTFPTQEVTFAVDIGGGDFVIIQGTTDTVEIIDLGGPPVPTTSEWGLVAMLLLLLAAGSIIYQQRQKAAATYTTSHESA